MRLPHILPFSKAPIYFFTACTVARRPLLACGAAHDVLLEVWQKSAQLDGWYVGRYLLMPDHVHFFASPSSGSKPRGIWNKMWKSVTARRLAKELKLQPPIWQEDTFDHILRGVESYREKWEYVSVNPVRAGLCSKADDWPWQGEIGRLHYK
jgi:REP element-mobilizing transposase RayT